MFLAVTVHIVLQERRVATTKKKSYLHFRRQSQPSTSEPEPEKIKMSANMD